MITIKRTKSNDSDFIKLVAQLDSELSERDGEDHAFYHQFNSIDTLKYTVVTYMDEKPMGCGAIKAFDLNTVEVKRMYVAPKARGKGIATMILKKLELWAKELNYSHCILETGKKQPEAIALYKKNGYTIIANYGQYEGIENSVCFQKNVSFKN